MRKSQRVRIFFSFRIILNWIEKENDIENHIIKIANQSSLKKNKQKKKEEHNAAKMPIKKL